MSSENDRKDAFAVAVVSSLLALAVFWLSYGATNFVAERVLGLWWYSLTIWTVVHMLCGFGCMALTRRCCDAAFKNYSERGIFALFLCVDILLIVWSFASKSLGMDLLLDLVVQIFIVAAACWWFWRGRPSQSQSDQSTPLQSVDGP